MSGMRETIQKQTEQHGGTVGSTQLILNQAYIDRLLELMPKAQSEIRIAAYDWRLYKESPNLNVQRLNQALFDARQRGVTVRALVDHQLEHLWYEMPDFTIIALPSQRTQHSKALCIDNKALFVGSHNLTKQANNLNYEMSIVTCEFEPIQQFITYFDKIWVAHGGS